MACRGSSTTTTGTDAPATSPAPAGSVSTAAAPRGHRPGRELGAVVVTTRQGDVEVARTDQPGVQGDALHLARAGAREQLGQADRGTVPRPQGGRRGHERHALTLASDRRDRVVVHRVHSHSMGLGLCGTASGATE